MTVDFATYCCPKDWQKLHANFVNHLESHNYDFHEIHIVNQRIPNNVSPTQFDEYRVNNHFIKTIDYHTILTINGINSKNEDAEKYTHGWGHSHYWKHHCVNHLIALNESTADYIVLSDADCHMSDSQGNLTKNTNWIKQGIEILKNDVNVLIVSPSDGSKAHSTQTMSQQLFLCERERLLNIDFDLPFEGFKEGGPMQEYYFMLEGRIGRYMEKNNLFRHMLGADCRYWHLQWH